MSMKVYLNGEVVTVDKVGGTPFDIPSQFARYSITGTNVKVSNIITFESETDAVINIQNQAGDLIGGLFEVRNYLSKFINSADSSGAIADDPQSELGTILFTDSALTVGSPLVINQAPVALTNNKDSILFLGAPDYAEDWINSSGVLMPDNGNGDSYITRVTMSVDPNQNNRSVTLELDIGGSQGIIFTDEKRLSVDTMDAKRITFLVDYFAGATFLANGGILYLTIDGNNSADVYDVSFKVQKTYKV